MSLAWALSQPVPTVIAFVVLMACSLLLFPQLGPRFLSAGRRRPDAPARARTAGHPDRRDPGNISPRSRRAIRQIVGNGQIDVMLDNIGLPYSGINIALSDSATVGPMDGEILISLNKKHTPTAAADRACCAASCRGASRNCSSSSSPRTSSTRS